MIFLGFPDDRRFLATPAPRPRDTMRMLWVLSFTMFIASCVTTGTRTII